MQRIKNHIEVIKGEGNVYIEGKGEIKEEAYQHFKRLLSAEENPNNYEDVLRDLQIWVLMRQM